MKRILQLFVFACSLLSVVGLNSCKKGQPFSVTKEKAIAQALEHGGELVKVEGDDGPYRYAFTFYCNAGEHQPGDSEGVKRGGHAMKFPIESKHYHKIYVFENAKNGALLVGVRFPVDDKGNTVPEASEVSD